MDLIIWLTVSAVVALLLWQLAPYHQRIIANRDIHVAKWEDPTH